jgi:hydroxymethylpyrimidine pyrophosphatase-like HAD family hydrolase
MTTHSVSTIRLPAALHRRFDVIIFDWDGTAVPDRHAEVPELNRVLEGLLLHGAWLAPVTGTNIDNLERQSLLAIAPAARGHLFVCTNRGSEVYTYGAEGGRQRVYLRAASPGEDRQLTAAAEELSRRLRARSLETAIVYDRLNRRKIDLIPLPEWHDPPKARIGELISATMDRLKLAGFRDIGAVMHLATEIAHHTGLADPRITSDGKYVEIGLTDKADSLGWLIEHVAAAHGITHDRILIAGDEFGDVGSFAGSDERMNTPVARGATIVSVGREPAGTPEGVLHVPGGPAMFLEILRWQLALRSS